MGFGIDIKRTEPSIERAATGSFFIYPERIYIPAVAKIYSGLPFIQKINQHITFLSLLTLISKGNSFLMPMLVPLLQVDLIVILLL
ncbi:hypothetical protein A3860_37895 [Niastella vici]|uniref:Uncharacterized protein n=1 Tax=Niastella vici TaxID=1703345 RepID=A0A1V9FM70_9BACT|nr:hypothetical protein A3860_37895 [Niastella vici]